MDIATKTHRTRTGLDSQHGTHRARGWHKPPAHARLRALLRADAQSAGRASAVPPPPKPATRRPTAGEIATATTPADNAASGQALDLPALKAALQRMSPQQLREAINEHNDDEGDTMSTAGDKRALIKRIVTYVETRLAERDD